VVCLDEKLTAGLTGTAVGAGGIGLIASTATGPAFFAAAVAWIGACAAYGIALGKLVLCLESNGHPEMAATIREKSDAILREVEEFKTWAHSIGASL
jgi:hypothetical protein